MSNKKNTPNKADSSILDSAPTPVEKALFLPALVSWLAQNKEKKIDDISVATIFHGTTTELQKTCKRWKRIRSE